MTPTPESHGHEHADRVLIYALQAVPASERPAVEAQIAACTECEREMAALRPIVARFAAWPIDVLRPPTSVWERLAGRIAAETGREPSPAVPSTWTEPDWMEAAPGISVKLLATDRERDRVSMLVRLDPGVDYPAHRHAGVEELHLLDGELTINDRKLRPGDYSRADPESVDYRVRSETGCTCVLITSPGDVLR